MERAELIARNASFAFKLGNCLCKFDGQCFRRNVEHWLENSHPVSMQLPRCPDLLHLRPCAFDHRCNNECTRPCPHAEALKQHVREYVHCPSTATMEAAAIARETGEAVEPTTKRMRTTTTTTTTTTTSTEVIESVPRRVLSGGKLADTFIAPPFTILDARAGYWQTRKREWFAIGIDSGAGRDDNLLGEGLSELTPGLTGTSIFDPVLVECALTWYAPRPQKGETPTIIVDPFAGGSVRGVVASKLGFLYIGTDVSQRQVDANRKQALEICADCEWQPRWACCCGSKLGEVLKGVVEEIGLQEDTRADMLITCGPYYDLEQYHGGEDDISMCASYESFLSRYTDIMSAATALLKPRHVAVTVVGNVRDATGAMHDLHGDTKRILNDCGNVLYCDAILQTSLASAPMRARRQMQAASKLVTTHQNVIVTCKERALTAADARRMRIRSGD